MIVLEGLPALSPFRHERLQARLQQLVPGLRLTGAWFVYFIEPEPGASPDTAALGRILEGCVSFEAPAPGASSRFVVPRLGTLSPWASKATEILRGAGLSVKRVERGTRLDLDGLASAAVASGAKLVFVCSPANPTGQAVPPADLLALARRLAGRALVVVDEAYGEYSDQPSMASFIDAQPNIPVLRTLSKAHALAAARIGCLLADPALVAVLRNCQAPYPLPSPCVQLALAGLSEPALVQTRSRVITVRAERERLQHELPGLPGVRRVYASQGNYILVRFDDAGAAFARAFARLASITALSSGITVSRSKSSMKALA